MTKRPAGKAWLWDFFRIWNIVQNMQYIILWCFIESCSVWFAVSFGPADRKNFFQKLVSYPQWWYESINFLISRQSVYRIAFSSGSCMCQFSAAPLLAVSGPRATWRQGVSGQSSKTLWLWAVVISEKDAVFEQIALEHVENHVPFQSAILA